MDIKDQNCLSEVYVPLPLKSMEGNIWKVCLNRIKLQIDMLKITLKYNLEQASLEELCATDCVFIVRLHFANLNYTFNAVFVSEFATGLI